MKRKDTSYRQLLWSLLLVLPLLWAGNIKAEDTYSVTFNVDMEEAIEDGAYDPDTYDVYMTGEITDWTEPGDEGSMLMEPHEEEDYIYTAEMELEEGDYEYKFFLVEDEPDWDNGEWEGDPNRVVNVTGEMEVNNTFGNVPYEVTFNVDMSNALEDETYDPEVHDVYMTGEVVSPEWTMPGEEGSILLEAHEEEENIYTTTMTIEEGEHEYKYFLVEDEATWDYGEWDGETNRLLSVAEDVTVEDTFGVEEEVTSSEREVETPSGITLEQNYPNPFNPATTIQYEIPTNTHVELTVYNAVGQEVETLVSGQVQAGSHEVRFDASDLSSGVYIYRLEAQNQVITRQMTFVK